MSASVVVSFMALRLHNRAVCCAVLCCSVRNLISILLIGDTPLQPEANPC